MLIAICLSRLFIQCNNDDNIANQDTTKEVLEVYNEEITTLKKFLSSFLQVNLKNIFYNAKERHFVIEQDILMPLEDARAHYNNSEIKKVGTRQQLNSKVSILPENVKSMEVFISSEVSPDWRAAIN